MSGILSIINNDNRRPAPKTSRLGAFGEELAAEHLIGLGYRPVLANFRAPIGRNRRGVAVTGEIDLIALDGDVLCFIEIKTRTSDEFGSPEKAVDLRKQRQITRASRIYRKAFGIRTAACRFDVVSVVAGDGEKPRIELQKAFWSETKFRKRSWSGED